MDVLLAPSTSLLVSIRRPFSSQNPTQPTLTTKPITALDHYRPPLLNITLQKSKSYNPISSSLQKHSSLSSIVGAGLVLTAIASITGGDASAAEIALLGSSLQLSEPENALSLPTWAIHVSSVVEWIIAMALVWQYGEKSGYEAWKGLSWGMVPLLGGAFCACTWHFFYNSESLSVLVALQGALTVIGNFTMCIAAFRIYKASQGGTENL
ncbi:Ycf49-like protein [Thalictrum thalictroides]|uniref:Ycf49-like protein n=1 Tax=Thalictrum thalictroides TaxID=46969 RepID=A0A7J6VC12_THATH|nr:Ycf49-like protein [Thalictrum thalictroides]